VGQLGLDTRLWVYTGLADKAGVHVIQPIILA